jgi:hypothetical protein
MRRAAFLFTGSLLLLVMAATPAAAHGVAGFTPTNFRTTIDSVTPKIPGVELRVVEAGSRLQLTNRTPDAVLVLGYRNEPYLRVGSDGVFENRRSPATYLNASRTAQRTVPGTADPAAPPEWRKVTSEPVARWHDHRVHWMGDQDPPAVQRNPDRRQVVIPDWVVPMRHGETAIEATGDLAWVPGPSPWPWLALATALFAATLFANRRVAPRVIALLLLGLIVGDVVHAIGTGLSVAAPLGTQLGRGLTSSPLSMIGWVLGGVGVWQLMRGRAQGLPMAGAAAALMAVSGGMADLTDLSRSQVPFAWGARMARLLVAASLGVGVGVCLACVAAVTRRGAPEVDPA